MSSLKDKLKFGESLKINEDTVTISPNHTSARLVGKIQIDEYDALGRKLFSSIEYNDVVLPGSIFILEQMFKRTAQDYNRFKLPNNDPNLRNADGSKSSLSSIENWNDLFDVPHTDNETGIYDYDPNTQQIPDIPVSGEQEEFLSDERIFGVMFGIGGEDSSAVIAPEFKQTYLSKFIPIRITGISERNSDINLKNGAENEYRYYLNNRVSYNDRQGNQHEGTAYYVKAFSEKPEIKLEWADGSGEIDDETIIYDSDVPVLPYAKMVFDIDELDIREYYRMTEGNINKCKVNQLGLVAGKPVWGVVTKQVPVYDEDGNIVQDEFHNNVYQTVHTYEIIDYTDVKLVTYVNFKSRDLSTDENTLKFTYKLYCL